MASITETSLGMIVPAAVGAAAAVATILMFQTQPPETIETRGGPETVREVAAPSLDSSRLDRVEREVTLLKQTANREPLAATAAADNPVGTTEAFTPPKDPAQVYAEQQALKADWFAQHAREPVDTSWAVGAEHDIDVDLDRLKEAQWAGLDQIDFEVTDVQCRSSLCVVKVGWDSVRTAAEKGAYLAMHDYAQNCTVTVFGPSPEDIEAEGPYVQEVLFDCAAFRPGKRAL